MSTGIHLSIFGQFTLVPSGICTEQQRVYDEVLHTNTSDHHYDSSPTLHISIVKSVSLFGDL